MVFSGTSLVFPNPFLQGSILLLEHECLGFYPGEQLFIAFHAESFAVLYPFLQVPIALFPSCNFVRKLVKERRARGWPRRTINSRAWATSLPTFETRNHWLF
jgi:hypothetical protein